MSFLVSLAVPEAVGKNNFFSEIVTVDKMIVRSIDRVNDNVNDKMNNKKDAIMNQTTSNNYRLIFKNLFVITLMAVSVSACRVNPAVNEGTTTDQANNGGNSGGSTPVPSATSTPTFGLSFTPPSPQPVAGACSSGASLNSINVSGTSVAQTTATTLNVTGPAMTYAYLDALCTIPATSSIVMAAGTSSIPLYFMGNTTGNYNLSATSTGLFPATGTLVINPGLPTTVVISGPTSSSAGICQGGFLVELEDSYSNNSPAVVDTLVNLTGEGSGYYYTDSNCTTVVSSVTLTTGASNASLYFKDNSPETLSMAVDSIGLVSGPAHAYTVSTAAPAKIVLTGPASDTVASCAGPFTVTTKDSLNNTVVVSSATTATIFGGGSMTYYTDSACATSATSVSIASGTSSKTFYVKSNLAQNTYLIASTTSLGSSNLPFTLTADAAAGLNIVGQSSVGAGDCTAAMSVVLEDIYGNPTPAVTTTTYNFTGVGSAVVYTDATCTTTASTFEILATADRMTFYMKDNTKESLVLAANATGLTGDTHGLVVTSGAPAKLVIEVETPRLAGECSLIGHVEVQDTLGNATNVSTNTDITLSDNGQGKYYVTSDCSGTAATSITVTAGSNRAYMYYRNQKAETTTVTASRTGLTSGTQTRVTNPAAPEIINIHANLALAGSNPGTSGGSQPLTLTAGDCAGPLKLAVQDKYFNLSPVSSSTTLTLTQYATSGNGQYYSDSGCTTAITTRVYASGESVKDIYYKGTRADVTNSKATTTLPGAPLPTSANSLTTVIPAPTHHLQLAGTNFLFSNECSPTFTVYARDIYDNLVTQTANLPINISAAIGSGQIFTGSSCTPATEVTSGTINIPSGASSMTFWLKDATTETINQVVSTTAPIINGTNILNVKASFTNVETYAGYNLNWGWELKQTEGVSPGIIYPGYTSQPVGAGFDNLTDSSKARFYRPDALVYHAGYLYYYDQNFCTIIRIDPVTTARTKFAGGHADCRINNSSSGSTSRIYNINGQFTFNLVNDALYFGDAHCIRKMDLATGGMVTIAGQCLSSGYYDHPIGSTALLNYPSEIIDMGTYLIFSDTGNNAIRKVDLTGSYEVTTLYSVPVNHSVKGTVYDGSRYVYYADGYSIARIDLLTAGYPSSVVAGVYDLPGAVDGAAAVARFGDSAMGYYVAPRRLALDVAHQYLYVGDLANSAVRRIDISSGGSYGTVTTVAGQLRVPGNVNGIGTASKLGSPNALALDDSGSLYVMDAYTAMRLTSYTVMHSNSRNNYFMNNNNIRKINLTTLDVSTLMGPTYESYHAWNTYPSGPRLTTPINDNQASYPLAYDGNYLHFYGSNTGGNLSMVTGNVVGANTGFNNFLRSGDLIHNGYYYYVSGSVVMRGTVSGGLFSAAAANVAIAGNGTNSVTDGVGTTTASFNSIKTLIGVDRNNNALYLWDYATPGGAQTLYLRKIDLSTSVVTTIRNHPQPTLNGNYFYMTVTYSAVNGVRSRYDSNTNAIYLLNYSSGLGNAGYFYKYDIATGTVSVLAGDGTLGIADGTGASAKLGTVVSPFYCIGAGYLWFTTYGSLRRIRLESGVVETLTTLNNPQMNQFGIIDGLLTTDARFADTAGSPKCEMTNQGLLISDGFGGIRRVY